MGRRSADRSGERAAAAPHTAAARCPTRVEGVPWVERGLALGGRAHQHAPVGGKGDHRGGDGGAVLVGHSNRLPALHQLRCKASRGKGGREREQAMACSRGTAGGQQQPALAARRARGLHASTRPHRYRRVGGAQVDAHNAAGGSGTVVPCFCCCCCRRRRCCLHRCLPPPPPWRRRLLLRCPLRASGSCMSPVRRKLCCDPGAARRARRRSVALHWERQGCRLLLSISLQIFRGTGLPMHTLVAASTANRARNICAGTAGGGRPMPPVQRPDRFVDWFAPWRPSARAPTRRRRPPRSPLPRLPRPRRPGASWLWATWCPMSSFFERTTSQWR